MNPSDAFGIYNNIFGISRYKPILNFLTNFGVRTRNRT